MLRIACEMSDVGHPSSESHVTQQISIFQHEKTNAPVCRDLPDTSKLALDGRNCPRLSPPHVTTLSPPRMQEAPGHLQRQQRWAPRQLGTETIFQPGCL